MSVASGVARSGVSWRARALLAGRAGSHSLAAVLARTPRELDGFPVTDAADGFLAGNTQPFNYTGRFA